MKNELEIKFETKEQSNNRRMEEAISRSGHERLLFFIELCEELKYFKKNISSPNIEKNNFIVE
jgi:hypothetical protein